MKTEDQIRSRDELHLFDEAIIPCRRINELLLPIGEGMRAGGCNAQSFFSGEIDFAFTAFAILFLFVPRLARFTYPSLACLFFIVQPWT